MSNKAIKLSSLPRQLIMNAFPDKTTVRATKTPNDLSKSLYLLIFPRSQPIPLQRVEFFDIFR